MAGDWIKIEHSTPDKPEIYQLSELLGIDPDAVVGKLVRLWVWADQQSVSGEDLAIAPHIIDRLTHQPGFSAALRKVDWLLARSGSLAIPHFDRHNGQSAKARAKTNRRVAAHRERRKPKEPPPEVTSVTEKVLPKPLPEKRREEKKRERESARAPATISDEEFCDIVDNINRCRKAWSLAPAFSAAERQAFQANLEILHSVSPQTWQLIPRFLAAKLPEGAGGWQPKSREKFIQSIGDVLGHASEWLERQPKPKPKPPPALATPEETPISPEEMKSLLSWKKPQT